MSSEQNIRKITRIILDHVRSPSLRHIQDPHCIQRVAETILECLGAPNSSWHKWSAQREALLRPAINCWVPVEDMQEGLNQLSGPPLTLTDVTQSLRTFQEEDYGFAQD